jgi:acyl-CoA reductase-like NAD-dependent aldehyde dehydrogenase
MTETPSAVEAWQQSIGGAWVDAAPGETLDNENPAHGQVIARVPENGAEDVDRAVKAAATAAQGARVVVRVRRRPALPGGRR